MRPKRFLKDSLPTPYVTQKPSLKDIREFSPYPLSLEHGNKIKTCLLRLALTSINYVGNRSLKVSPSLWQPVSMIPNDVCFLVFASCVALSHQTEGLVYVTTGYSKSDGMSLLKSGYKRNCSFYTDCSFLSQITSLEKTATFTILSVTRMVKFFQFEV